jgi:hypothetical protein
MENQTIQTERRKIKFDPVPHTYVDEYNKPYISMTTLIGKMKPKFDRNYWLVYKALEQIPNAQVWPEDMKKGIIGLRLAGQEIKAYWKEIHKFFHGKLPQSVQAISKVWEEKKDEACEWGTYRHEYLEDCIDQFYSSNPSSSTGKRDVVHVSDIRNSGFRIRIESEAQLEQSPLIKTHPSIYQRLLTAIRNGWTVYVEKILYSSHYQVAGTIDVVLVKNNLIYLLDWKTNKFPLKFEAGYWKRQWNGDRTKKLYTGEFVKTDDRMNPPLEHLYSCKGVTYTLQLSGYAALAEPWGFKVQGLMLCHIAPEIDREGNPIMRDGRRVEKDPEFIPVKYIKKDVVKMFNWWKSVS